jgi:hypothetical protein
MAATSSTSSTTTTTEPIQTTVPDQTTMSTHYEDGSPSAGVLIEQ